MARPKLVPLNEMVRLPGFDVPKQLYTVLWSPAPLAGMSEPRRETPWTAIADAGFAHVVCLTTDSPPYDPSPLDVLHATALEDLYGDRFPRDPRSEAKRVHRAALTVLEALRRGEGTVVHCIGGTGRTGTVIAVVLRLLGMPMDDVSTYLKEVHRARGGRWPESPWQRDVVAAIPTRSS